VLLFGPLYHLTEAADRRQALGEARRVLAPSGRLLAMAVCRFASLLDGLYKGWLDDPDFRPIVDQDLADGQHHNPDPVGGPEFFTTACFHTPDGASKSCSQRAPSRRSPHSSASAITSLLPLSSRRRAREAPVSGRRERYSLMSCSRRMSACPQC
jgi:hypothetical protein